MFHALFIFNLLSHFSPLNTATQISNKVWKLCLYYTIVKTQLAEALL